MSPSPDPAGPGPGVPDRARGDACPGALRLHTADDGSLARVRLPGGLLTVGQALALADAAEQLGDAQLETTSRGNVQLRGLPEDCGQDLGARLRAAGLLPSDRHERVRNIVASPLAGVDGNGHADVTTWARELDAALCAADWTSALSGRFLFALDDGRGDVAGLDADVTLIASPGGGALLRLGRAGTALPVPTGEAVAAALRAAGDFLALLRESGAKAWRIREADPDGTRLTPPGTPVVPLPALPGTLPQAGPVTGAGGRHGLAAGLPFGRAGVAQWRLLAAAAADGAGELRVTPWRGVVLPGLDPARSPGWAGRLAAAGLGLDPHSPWERAMACTGTPGCAKSLADVRGDAARALAAAGPGGGRLLPVHWSGCERRCGHPAGEWVDALATPDGYRVAVRRPDTAPTYQATTTQQMADAVARARRTK
ncbi:precorrin-3B synthase [Kitasatospora indigofera]|uniref:precorrin-3B synthase n=1 Tax=Kitasatospora indigofera TaxID=67307 RepID=UPI0033B75F25